MEWLQDLGATIVAKASNVSDDSGGLLDLFSSSSEPTAPSAGGDLYSALLEEAYRTDLSDVEQLNIFSMAASPVFGTPVIVVDGYCFPDVSDETLNRKVLLLFVRTFDPLVDIKFVIAYAHFTQHTPSNSIIGGIIEQLDSRYRDNLLKCIIVHSSADWVSGATKCILGLAGWGSDTFVLVEQLEHLYQQLGSSELCLSNAALAAHGKAAPGAAAAVAEGASAEGNVSEQIAKERQAEGLVGTRAGQAAMATALKKAARKGAEKKKEKTKLAPVRSPQRAVHAHAPLNGRSRSLSEAVTNAVCNVSADKKADAQARFLKGRQLRQQGKEAESMRELKAAVALDPTHKEAQLFLGAALLIKEEARSALVHLEAAVASDESYAEAWTYLGCAHKELEQMDQSLEAFGRALAIDPANAKANYHAARAHHVVGNVPECIAAYQAALATNPGNSEARFHLGRALEVQVLHGGDTTALPEAKKQFEEAVKLKPKDCEFRCCLGRVLAAMGEHNAAAQQWATAVKLGGPADVELQRKHAAALEAAGNTDQAVQVIRQAVKNDPRDFRTVREYGQLLQRLGFAREAKEQLKRADQLEGIGGNKSAAVTTGSLRGKDDPRSWNVKQTITWFNAKFPFAFRYADKFTELAVDGATLLELEDEDLASSDFGVSVRVHRARILEEVAQLRTGCGVDQEGATVHKRKAQIEVDPSLEKASEEQLMLFDFEPVTRLWTEKTVMAKISKQPFSKGAMRAAYRMLDVAQHGPMKHKVCKMYMDKGAANEGTCRRDVQLQMISTRYAEAFNQHAPPKMVTFLSASYGRRKCNNELVAIEMFVPGKYIKFNSNSDFALASGDPNFHKTPQAFSHFTYVHSQCKEIVVDIQGVNEYYTDPQLHNVTGEGYGEGNLGQEGIDAFFSKHVCNSVCEYLGLPQYVKKTLNG